MKTLSSQAQTQFVIVQNAKIAYRQFGEGLPLILLNRFRGTLDTWDPLFLDGLAQSNHVLIFDYSGIGLSEGDLPLDIFEVAELVVLLADSLKIKQFNVLGWSYGGLVAQTVTFSYQQRVLKTVLIGTNPPGENATPIEPAFFERALKPVNDLEDEYVLFYEPASLKSKAAAKESHERIAGRLDRDLIPSTNEVFQRYFAGSAVFKADSQDFRGQYRTLETPVLILSGDHDISFATENWFPLLKTAPSMQHIIIHDAGHGPQHQHPKLTSAYINVFLEQ